MWDMAFSAFIFIIAFLLASGAFQRASGINEFDRSAADLSSFSNLLLFSPPGDPAWSYARHDGSFPSLAAAGGVNLTKAAYLVALLADNETGTEDAFGSGPYAIGVSFLDASGKPVSASCPSCGCGGLCSVVLDFTPPAQQNASQVFVANRIVRLVGQDGEGAGIATARVSLYRRNG
jgi:hypothetical protein